jgi:RHS repeat-associated protein
LTYLHSDHLGSTVLSTLSSNAFEVGQGYYGYGQYRSGGSLPTDHRYTGQKLDTASGLMYYGARYYDRTVGLFVSPDTLVPDPTNVWDYNRFMYVRGNPLAYVDFSGHTPYPITVRSFAPFPWFGGGFHGDDRGYSTDVNATARVHQQIAFDTDQTTVSAIAWSDPTYHRFLPGLKQTEVPDSAISKLLIAENSSSRVFSFEAHYAGANPLTPGAPAIDVFSGITITENRQSQTLTISGQLTGDNFPATEAFISDPSGQVAFLDIGYYDGSPYTSLWGENQERGIASFSLTLHLDEQGNFAAVLFGAQKISLAEWNARFEQSDPHRNRR